MSFPNVKILEKAKIIGQLAPLPVCLLGDYLAIGGREDVFKLERGSLFSISLWCCICQFVCGLEVTVPLPMRAIHFG